MRELRALQSSSRRLEAGALDLFFLGRVRTREQRAAALQAVSAARLRDAFAGMLAAPASAALTGKVRAGAAQRLRDLLPDPAA